MPPVAIPNPILNSPFEEPARYFKFDDDGITDRVAPGRRPSSYFVPIAPPKKKVKQPSLDADWSKNQAHENGAINPLRTRVRIWRHARRPHITPTTEALLDYRTRKGRERRLFFCQVEALETLMFLTEAADRHGDGGVLRQLRADLDAAGTPLTRLACKMATGSGKTVVMAMAIAWHALNKAASPHDKRFTDAFLVVAPGITIRDRLRVLRPSDPANCYRAHDLVPPEHLAALGTAKVVVTNFHAFKPRETVEAPRLNKLLATGGRPGAFTETPDQVALRVCRELGTRKGIVVLNDEAHHCYRRKPDAADEKLTGDEKREAAQRDEEARLWLTGLEAVHRKVGVKVAYDLSATPFYLKGSGYPEGTLFPWVVSDFSLIDAIESGIVKVPRVPVQDDTLGGNLPTFRELWVRIRDDLPKKGRGAGGAAGPPAPPKELEAALQALYSHYDRAHREWERDADGRAAGRTPPVFIVVCNTTNVSKLVFDHVAGYETAARHPDGTPVVAAGRLPLFSNVDHGRWVARPNTILVDSAQLESDDGMSADFKKLAAAQIGEFKAEYRQRHPDRGLDDISDQDLMREVLNTVGKDGKLGEHVKCVVSVSMLTEGWDCNTVTHVLGVRAFGTQLLCEQVVGRGLRRASYTLNDNGHFDPEYAEVYGVPFQFIPCAGDGPEREDKDPVPRPGRIKAVPERVALRPHLEVTFPRLASYYHELPPDRLTATFSDESRLVLSTAELPTRSVNAPIVGESVTMTLDELRRKREQEVAFAVAREVVKNYPADPGAADPAGASKVWLLPQVFEIARRWVRECVVLKDSVFPQLLLLAQLCKAAAGKVHRAIAAAAAGAPRVRAVLQPYDAVGTSAVVSFDSRRSRFQTDPAKCHVNFVVYDSDWERHFAQTPEDLTGRFAARPRRSSRHISTAATHTHRATPCIL
ncbi:MAG: restriction endonuclease subunit R [Isosphaera sp.]|nr:restriction endonuclease subunit R [Isosphaera sp.]